MSEWYCEYCVYYLNYQCRRYPPKVFVTNGEKTTMYPDVEMHDQCGEFKQIPKT